MCNSVKQRSATLTPTYPKDTKEDLNSIVRFVEASRKKNL